MIIIKAQGGIGNQLFIYALYKKYECLGKQVYIDKSLYYTRFEKRQWLLGDLVRDIKYCSREQKKLLANNDLHYIGRIWQSIIGKKKTHIYESDDYAFDNILDLENAYLDGYWQNINYFDDIKSEIVESLFFPELPMEYRKYEEAILKSNSVSIHVRRGDYLKWQNIYQNIGDSDYYERAIDIICRKISNPLFFVFSDDILWCKKRFSNIKNIDIIFCQNSGMPYDDLNLMQKCKHNIIANSTFSWWGAWLNQNTDKIVCAPKEWNVSTKKSNLCDDWISISIFS